MAIPLPKPFTPNNYTILSLTKHSPKLTTTFAFSSGRKLIESGSVQQITAKDASSLIENEGFQLLDIRPEWEREKAFVRGSLHVPLFVKEEDSGPITLLKKWVHFGYIGLWTGQLLTTINEKFLREVEELVPDKEEKLIVACGEGLRLSFSLFSVFLLFIYLFLARPGPDKVRAEPSTSYEDKDRAKPWPGPAYCLPYRPIASLR
ncbi:hypothetical protein AMTR_s00007p00076840 [Amborella trichopoda]|uniref:Rhodanese domain-containing protein n=1 Tax=Amborella trichopoda TaxID=13333 RepID=W1PDV8_AMBTC|nr:hypothetical protein AMTR_s00007p00076840 [Amborella trichopoda]